MTSPPVRHRQSTLPSVGHHAVEEVVLRSDVEAIVEREDLVRRAAETALPDRLAVVDAQRDDAAVGRRHVDAIGGERRRARARATSGRAPDQLAVGRAEGDESRRPSPRRPASRCPRPGATASVSRTGSSQASEPSADVQRVSAPASTTKSRPPPAAAPSPASAATIQRLRAGDRGRRRRGDRLRSGRTRACRRRPAASSAALFSASVHSVLDGKQRQRRLVDSGGRSAWARDAAWAWCDCAQTRRRQGDGQGNCTTTSCGPAARPHRYNSVILLVPSVTHQTIIVLDFGSQFTQLIARRLRELSVYSEIWPPDTPAEKIRARNPVGIILSGGPKSVSDAGAPKCDPAVFDARQPGARHLLRHAADGGLARRPVAPAPQREFGHAHGQRSTAQAPSARAVRRRARRTPRLGEPRRLRRRARRPDSRSSRPARTRRSRRWRTPARALYAMLFHPEVVHTERGLEILRNFAYGVCGCTGDWTMASFVEEATARIRAQVGRRARGLRAERRRRFDRRGADHPPRDRQPADLHLRRQRRAAARRGGADPQALRAAAAAAGLRRRVGAVSRSAGRRHRSRAEAQDHRRDVHRRVRGGGGQARAGGFPRAGHAVSRRHRVGRRSSGSRR